MELTSLFNFLNIGYIFSVNAIVYLAIETLRKVKGIGEFSTAKKRLLTAVVALVVGLVYWTYGLLEAEQAFPSYTTAIVLYDYLIKKLLLYGERANSKEENS